MNKQEEANNFNYLTRQTAKKTSSFTFQTADREKEEYLSNQLIRKQIKTK